MEMPSIAQVNQICANLLGIKEFGSGLRLAKAIYFQDVWKLQQWLVERGTLVIERDKITFWITKGKSVSISHDGNYDRVIPFIVAAVVEKKIS